MSRVLDTAKTKEMGKKKKVEKRGLPMESPACIKDIMHV